MSRFLRPFLQALQGFLGHKKDCKNLTQAQEINLPEAHVVSLLEAQVANLPDGDWRNGPHLRVTQKEREKKALYEIPDGYTYVDYRVINKSIGNDYQFSVTVVMSNSKMNEQQATETSQRFSAGAKASCPDFNIVTLDVDGSLKTSRKKTDAANLSHNYSHCSVIVTGSVGNSWSKSILDLTVMVRIEKIEEKQSSSKDVKLNAEKTCPFCSKSISRRKLANHKKRCLENPDSRSSKSHQAETAAGKIKELEKALKLKDATLADLERWKQKAKDRITKEKERAEESLPHKKKAKEKTKEPLPNKEKPPDLATYSYCKKSAFHHDLTQYEIEYTSEPPPLISASQQHNSNSAITQTLARTGRTRNVYRSRKLSK